MGRSVRIAGLQGEVEARLLEDILKQRHIPHAIVSHQSLAFDGIFQAGAGWGMIEAPEEYSDQIRQLLEDLRQEQQNEPDSGSPRRE